MSRPVTHIVHKLNLEIEAPGERQARHLYGQAGELLQQYVLPQLEAWLQQYDQEERYIRIDTLEVSIDAAGATSMEAAIKEQLASAIAAQIAAVVKDTDGDTVTQHSDKPIHRSEPAQLVEAFLHFLEIGSLPWWFAGTAALSDTEQIIDAIVQQEASFVPLFLEKIAGNPIALKRLLLQYDAVLLSYLYSLLAPVSLLAIVRQYEQEVVALKGDMPEAAIRQQYWISVWTLYSPSELQTIAPEPFGRQLQQTVKVLNDRLGKDDRPLPIVLSSVREQDHPGISRDAQRPQIMDQQKKDIPGDERTPEDRLPQPDPVSADGWIMDHAGLILLHPFLQYFFLELGLLEGEQFVDDPAKGVAVHLLHYLATGSEQSADFALSFEKYLCGMEPQETTYRYTVLNDKMKTEAASLLESVIKHWEILKNSSAEGLREGFLQRKGKLLIREDSHRLIMERHTLDILVERIPWNVSLVKLPWRKELLHIEWQG